MEGGVIGSAVPAGTMPAAPATAGTVGESPGASVDFPQLVGMAWFPDRRGFPRVSVGIDSLFHKAGRLYAGEATACHGAGSIVDAPQTLLSTGLRV
jgi:hypothetical protein